MNENTFEYQEEWAHPLFAGINLTEDCNLKCIYCFVNKNPNNISFQTVKDIVDWLYLNRKFQLENNLINEEKKCTVWFFGGEPMLRYNDIIVPIIKYINDKYLNIFNFTMTTNGTLFTQERIDFLVENKVSILFSLDGLKEVQDYNRPSKNEKKSSFEMAIKNIPYLLNKYPDVEMRGTIYPDTCDQLFKSYLFAECIGFRHINFLADRYSEWNEKQIESLKKEIRKIFIYRINQYLNNIIPIDCDKINENFYEAIDRENNIILNINKKEKRVIRCGLGTLFCGINTFGDIYGCQEFSTINNQENIFYIGNIYNDGIDKDKHSKLLRLYLNSSDNLECINKERCFKCPYNNVCNDKICLSNLYKANNNFNSDSEISCIIKKEMFYNVKYTLRILINKYHNENFINYLKTFPIILNFLNKEE